MSGLLDLFRASLLGKLGLKPEGNEETYAHAERGSPAWDNAWENFSLLLESAGLGDGSDLEQAHVGEGWEYMGTERRNIRLVHVFRHGCHPLTNEREYLHVFGPILPMECRKEQSNAV